MKITAVIMCSGLGRRMGKNKLLMPVADKKMYEYVFNTINNIVFYKTIVVTPYDEIKNYAESKGFITAYNNENEEGISASIRIGTNLSEDSDGIMFFTADQPFIDVQTIHRLIFDFENKNKITVPVLNGKNKNPVIFPAKYKKELMSLRGDVGGKQIINANKAGVSKVLFENERPFLDIDTMDDIEKIKLV